MSGFSMDPARAGMTHLSRKRPRPAACILTSDNDLLQLGSYGDIRVVKVAEWVETDTS
jgi:hypothetical protein